MRIFYYLFLLIVAICGASFATLNLQTVDINLLKTHSMPLALLVALTFALGCLFGLVVAIRMVMKSKFNQYRLRKRLTLAQKELDNLRALPLREKVVAL
jgi:putative membrane protein